VGSSSSSSVGKVVFSNNRSIINKSDSETRDILGNNNGKIKGFFRDRRLGLLFGVLVVV
jgi:hypothetical protein